LSVISFCPLFSSSPNSPRAACGRVVGVRASWSGEAVSLLYWLCAPVGNGLACRCLLVGGWIAQDGSRHRDVSTRVPAVRALHCCRPPPPPARHASAHPTPPPQTHTHAHVLSQYTHLDGFLHFCDGVGPARLRRCLRHLWRRALAACASSAGGVRVRGRRGRRRGGRGGCRAVGLLGSGGPYGKGPFQFACTAAVGWSGEPGGT